MQYWTMLWSRNECVRRCIVADTELDLGDILRELMPSLAGTARAFRRVSNAADVAAATECLLKVCTGWAGRLMARRRI